MAPLFDLFFWTFLFKTFGIFLGTSLCPLSLYLHHSLDDFIKAWDFKNHISSFQFSHSVMSDSSWPHEPQHARPPCPSSTPGVHSNSRPSSRWCHPAISSSVIPFTSCPQFLVASESFPMSQLFAWGGQSTGVSALASFLPKNNPGLISFRMDWLDLKSTSINEGGV